MKKSPQSARILAALLLTGGVALSALACRQPEPKPDLEPELVTEEVVVPEIDLSDDIVEQGPATVDPKSVPPPSRNYEDDDDDDR